jgi:hypothetical protein
MLANEAVEKPLEDSHVSFSGGLPIPPNVAIVDYSVF